MRNLATRHVQELLTLVTYIALQFPSPTLASTPVLLDQFRDSFPLGTHLEYLEDQEASWNIDDVSSPPLSKQFRRSRSDILNFGYTSSAVWVRVSLVNTLSSDADWDLVYELPVIDQIDLYISTSNGQFIHKHGGLAPPVLKKNTSHRNFVFPLTIKAGQKVTLYMRFHSQSTMLIWLSVWNPKALVRHEGRIQYFLGAGVGVLAVLVAYNLLVFFTVRDRTYLYLVLTLLAFGIYQISLAGVTRQYIWSNHPWWSLHSPIFFGAVSQFFGILFTRTFLGTKKRAPTFDRLLLGVIPMTVVAGSAAFINLLYANIFVSVSGLLVLSFAMTATVHCWVKGYSPARLFFLAWSFTFAGGALFVITMMGGFKMTLFAEFGFFIGFCISSILFSYALFDRLQSLQIAYLDETVARQRAERNVRESEERYRHLVEDINDVIYGLDAQGVIRYISPAIETISGYSPSEVVGEHFSTFAHKEDMPTIIEMFESILEGNLMPHEYRILTKKGEIRWVRTHSRPFMEGSVVAGVRGVLTDVTERKDAEEALRKHREHLEEMVEARSGELKLKNEELRREMTRRTAMEEELVRVQRLEAVGRLAGGIAHDFNNILTAILTSISVTKHYGNLDSESFMLLTDAENASLRGKDLSQQLLTFATGGSPIKRVSHIGGLIEDTTQFSLSGSNVKCEYVISDDLWLTEIDEGQIAQVIQNVVLNAKQSMIDGGIITIRAENAVLKQGEHFKLKGGEYIKISIEDRGHGIPKEMITKIFDPFFTSKEKGKGLGLATALSIINHHDGYMDVTSELGMGTTFYIYLPASRASLTRDIMGSGNACGGTGRILFIDDDHMVRKSSGVLLRRLGYEVEFASDGAEGITLYETAIENRQPFDVVIMDLTIPGGMGGREAMKELAKIDPDAKVVVSSGYSADVVMTEFEKYGFCDVVRKPYKVDEMAEVLNRIFADKKGGSMTNKK